MRLRSASDLVNDVRVATDTEYATDRFPDAEILEHVNQSILCLYTMLDRMDHTYYQSSTTFMTSSGTGAYSLPSDFWVLKGVTVQLSSGRSIRARKYMPEEAPNLDSVNIWNSYSYPLFYRLQGPNIVFKPSPTGSYAVTLDYTPLPQRLTLTPATDFDGIAGFERWVILDAGIKVKAKDSLDPSQLQAEQAKIEQWIMSIATERDAGSPETIQEVQNVDIGRVFDDRW